MLEHQHLLVRAEVLNPPKDINCIQKWLRDLIHDLNMKIMIGPYAAYCEMPGNRGLTAVVIIETSHIVLHSWDEKEPYILQLDVYSCSKLNPKVIWDYMNEFDPSYIDYKFLDRKNKLIEFLP